MANSSKIITDERGTYKKLALPLYIGETKKRYFRIGIMHCRGGQLSDVFRGLAFRRGIITERKEKMTAEYLTYAEAMAEELASKALDAYQNQILNNVIKNLEDVNKAEKAMMDAVEKEIGIIPYLPSYIQMKDFNKILRDIKGGYWTCISLDEKWLNSVEWLNNLYDKTPHRVYYENILLHFETYAIDRINRIRNFWDKEKLMNRRQLTWHFEGNQLWKKEMRDNNTDKNINGMTAYEKMLAEKLPDLLNAEALNCTTIMEKKIEGDYFLYGFWFEKRKPLDNNEPSDDTNQDKTKQNCYYRIEAIIDEDKYEKNKTDYVTKVTDLRIYPGKTNKFDEISMKKIL